MRLKRLVPLPAILLATLPSPGAAQVVVHPEQVHYYEVRGQSAAEIDASMADAAPREIRPFLGYTRWWVRWRFRYAPAPDGCRMTEVRVELADTVVLPRWSPDPRAPGSLHEHWSRFTRRLLAHEQGHREIGAAAAHAIHDRLRQLRAPRCAGMSDSADREANLLLDRYRAREREYDRRTEHGLTQGAVWPPGR